jgi:transcriptional regulator with XRE-family HTH domain
MARRGRPATLAKFRARAAYTATAGGIHPTVWRGVLYTRRTMADEEREDRYTAECLRLVQLLESIARKKRISIRSLEKSMGVGEGVFNKILRGKITLHYRHVLMLCDALEIGWKELFAELYGLEPTPADERNRDRILFLLRVRLLTPEQAARFLADLPELPELPDLPDEH